MTIAYTCVLLMVIFPYFFIVLAKSGPIKYDNRRPREYLENLQGFRKRAYWTHLNSFEAFPAFAVGVIIAHLKGSPQHIVDILAIAFMVFRIFYSIFYLTDKSTLRSVFWGLAFLCVVALFLI